MHAVEAKKDAYVVFKIDAPPTSPHQLWRTPLHRAPMSHIDFLHSFDAGKTWATSYSLTDTAAPWDVIIMKRREDPRRTRSDAVQYFALMAPLPVRSVAAFSAVRMEVNHKTEGGTALWK